MLFVWTARAAPWLAAAVVVGIVLTGRRQPVCLTHTQMQSLPPQLTVRPLPLPSLPCSDYTDEQLWGASIQPAPVLHVRSLRVFYAPCAHYVRRSPPATPTRPRRICIVQNVPCTPVSCVSVCVHCNVLLLQACV
jgi:hypothetical protein